ncbi:hypothetical protein AB6A23_12050 [Paenibacillus tarimensis]
MDFKDKISILKAYEIECYRICVYLLGDNRPASIAAEETMVDLFKSESFWQADEEQRRKLLQRFAVSRSLQARKQAV